MPVVALDDALDHAVNRLSVIKIDAEGWERKILAGAQRLIIKHSPSIICEINRPALSRNGSSELELREFMSSLGYSTYFISLAPHVELCDGKILRKLGETELLDLPYVFNLLFTRHEAVANW